MRAGENGWEWRPWLGARNSRTASSFGQPVSPKENVGLALRRTEDQCDPWWWLAGTSQPLSINWHISSTMAPAISVHNFLIRFHFYPQPWFAWWSLNVELGGHSCRLSTSILLASAWTHRSRNMSGRPSSIVVKTFCYLRHGFSSDPWPRATTMIYQ